MMLPRRTMLVGSGLLAPYGWSFAHDTHSGYAAKQERLPLIGPAADFRLDVISGGQMTLADGRGKALVITFMYASCRETCPLLIARLVAAQALIPARTAARALFLAVTVDPETDTPDILRTYAENLGATGPGWRFLTGSRNMVDAMARGYGVAVRRHGPGDVDHTVLTSIVDPHGMLRVQYLGERFAPAAFARDITRLFSAA